MGNFCGKKPPKNHQNYRDSMFSNTLPNINDEFINRLVDQWHGSVIAYFKQCFKEHANKQDNSLDQNDFINIFPQLAAFPKNVKQKAFDFFDRDKSGRVDFKEFCQSLSICCKSDINSKIYLLFMLFDTDNDKFLTKNEMQTLIKFCQPYIFRMKIKDSNNSNNKNLEQTSQGTGDQQQISQLKVNQMSQIDKLSQTQGNIDFKDGYVMQDNIKILNKGVLKDQSAQQETTISSTQGKQQNQKEIQKNQQLFKVQQEKEIMQYLYNKKSEKISYQAFHDWAIEYFNILEFFQMFELVPDPLLEREIIRQIIKEEGEKDRQINQLLLEQRKKQSQEQQQQQNIGTTDIQENQKNKKVNTNSKQSKGVASNADKLQQKERFTETVYVVSWKWWFMWRYYINYAYKIKKLQNQQAEKNVNKGDKANTNAINFNIKESKSPKLGGNNADAMNNPQSNKGEQIQRQGVFAVDKLGDDKYVVNSNDFSNIANHQATNNNSFYNSRNYFDSKNNSPSNQKRQNLTRKDSNNSRNSMVDLEFNNSIPSERQEEQKMKYNLEPNAFKNNLELNFNTNNIQTEGIQNDPNWHQMENSPMSAITNQQNNIIRNFQIQQKREQFNYTSQRVYSPSKVNHDANNFAQQVQILNDNDQYIESAEDIMENQKDSNQHKHNKPKESEFRQSFHQSQNIKTAGDNQYYKKQFNNNHNGQSGSETIGQDNFQNQSWLNQQHEHYEPLSSQSPNKIITSYTHDGELEKKKLLINPQQVQQNIQQNQQPNYFDQASNQGDPNHAQNSNEFNNSNYKNNYQNIYQIHQQDDQFNLSRNESNNYQTQGQANIQNIQQYNQRQIHSQYNGFQQNNQNSTFIQQDNLIQSNNYYNKNNDQINKNNENSSTLFSQSKFNICKPIQGLKGEALELPSQDDLSKSNLAANNTNKNKNNTFNQQSEFAKEQYLNSVSPNNMNSRGNSPFRNIQFDQEQQQKQDQIVQENIASINLNAINKNTNKAIDTNINTTNFNNQTTDRMLQDYNMDEIDNGIQNTEEFDNHEEEEDQKRSHEQHIRFQQYGGDRPTQIDNSDLEGEYQGELQKNILRNHDYVIMPEKAWEKLFGWYGGGPIFKRKRIVDIQKNYKTVELYPPLLIGYKCKLQIQNALDDTKKTGEINYDTRQEQMVSSWKTLRQLMKKFSKLFKTEKIEDILYYKKMGQQWKKAVDLDHTILIDLQIESGTIFLFLTKAQEEKFVERQNFKQNNQNNSYVDILDQYEVGDSICISHPSERIEKKGYIFQIKAGQIQIHFKRESFRNDIIFEKKQLENYIKQENNNLNTQHNIEQSLLHEHNHIKYLPKMIGLANLGNTCFINCIIQFLVHTPFFRQYLLDELYLDSINLNGNQYNTQNNSNNFSPNNTNGNYNTNEKTQNNLNENEGKIQLIRELSQLTKFLQQKPYNDIYDPVRPQNLKKAIDISMPHFSGHEQHDAQEFLQGFLDKLNDEVKIKRIVQVNKKDEGNNSSPNTQINKGNNQSNRPSNISAVVQTQQISKDNIALTKEKSVTNNLVEVQNSQPLNLLSDPNPQYPVLKSQSQNDPQGEAALKQKKDSANEAAENQKKQVKQEVQEFSIIKDVYMGQTINQIQCSGCGNVNYKQEDFYSISLPLPIKNEILYEVTFVPRITKGVIKPMKKFGVKIPRSATLGDFNQAFQKISKISSSQIVFAEIYKNNVQRNMYDMDSSIPMRNLGIRSNDQITAYEIISTYKDLEDEIFSLYPHNYTVPSKTNLKDIKEGEFVDLNVGDNQWVHAQVEKNVQNDQKTECTVQINVLYENLSKKLHTQKMRSDSKQIQPFRSQLPFYPKEKIFVIFAVNRRAVNNMMEKFGIPLCVIVPCFLTWKELHLLVFNQVKRCIDFNYLIKKHQTASKLSIKSKTKQQKSQGYRKLGGEQEELDQNDAALTYQNDEQRIKQQSFQEQKYNVRDHRQKAPSFHGFIDENPQNQPVYEEDEYTRIRKSLFNYQQVANSGKSPSLQNQCYSQLDGQKQQPPQLYGANSEMQNQQKANTITAINQNIFNDNYQTKGSIIENSQNINQKKKQNIIKQSVNLESFKKNQHDNYHTNRQQQFNVEEYFAAFNGEINNTIDFLESSYFPYKLRAIEQNAQRCAICDLPLLPDYTSKECCEGCEPGLIERPIFWDIKSDSLLLFTIDWKDSLSFNPSSMIPQNDERQKK